MSDDHETRQSTPLVGYKRPPVANRFQKGASGNPSGRPAKKARAITYQSTEAQLDLVLLQEMTRLVPVTENGQTSHMPMMRFVVRSMALSAAKGNHKSQVALIKLHNDFHDQWFDILTQTHQASLQYKRSWAEEIDYCRTHGLPAPDPAPHPAEMIQGRGRIIYNGPQNPKEKADWEALRALRAEGLKDNEQLLAEAVQAHDPSLNQEEIASNTALIEQIDAICPDEATRRQPGFDLQRHRQSWPGYSKLMAGRAKWAKRHKQRD